MRTLILVDKGFEDIGFLYPYYRLKEEGFEVVVAGPLRDAVKGKSGYFEVNPDKAFSEVVGEKFDLLVIPGGRAPEELRLNSDVTKIVKSAFEEGWVVAAICHGPQVLISAGLLKGGRCTCYPGIRDDVINAGATYSDEPVVVNEKLVTSRYPGPAAILRHHAQPPEEWRLT